MKRAQLIGIAVAGVAGLGAFVLMKGMVDKKPVTKTTRVHVNATEVLVAQKDIGLGEVVTRAHYSWQRWPKDGVRPGMLTGQQKAKVQKLLGSVARAPIIAGEPITEQKLIKPGQGGVLAAILPKGMRAVSTPIQSKTAAGGLILPNDHVDVILIRRKRGRGGDEHVADTLFRNVRVLAIGQQLETKQGKKAADSANSTTTASLELTPSQAEMLALANSMGEISLSLRSIADLRSDQQNASGGDPFRDRSSAIRVMRYGTRTRAYGVN